MRGDEEAEVVDTDDEPNPETWRCVDDGRRCSCGLVGQCGFGPCPLGPGDPVPYCGQYEVCTLTAPTRCMCEFLEKSESAPMGQRVSSCPAAEDGAPLATELCAAEGDPCARAALSEANLGGCCEGLVCDLDRVGEFRCRATEDDALLSCRRAGASSHSALELTSALLTNQGEVRATDVGVRRVALRADGSVQRATLYFLSGDFACELSIEIERLDADDLTAPVTSVSIRGFPCGLASADDFATDPQAVSVGTLSVEPRVHCEGHIDLLCVHGTFAIEITDHIPSQTGSAELAFFGPITFSGTLCGETN